MSNKQFFITEHKQHTSFDDVPTLLESLLIRWEGTYDSGQRARFIHEIEQLEGVESVREFRYAAMVDYFPHVVMAGDLSEKVRQHIITVLKADSVDIVSFLGKRKQDANTLA